MPTVTIINTVLVLNQKFRACNKAHQIFLIWLYKEKDKTK